MTEQEQIKEAFEDLLKSLRKETSKENRQKIKEAFEFANEAHKGVKRRSGEPYILHPLAVAKIAVKEIGLGTTSVISALLHDVVEDTDYTVEDIANLFGPKVASTMRAVYYFPQLLPIAVASLVMGWIFRPQNGALNALLKAVGLGSLQHDWLGKPDTALIFLMLIMIWIQVGYPLVIFMSGLQRVDPELYEAASLDGANWWQRFLAITLPAIKPEIFVVALTCTIAALKVFGPVYMLTKGGPGTSTIVPSYYSYVQFFQSQQVGYGATIATALTVVIIVVAVIFTNLQEKVAKEDEE